MLEILPVTAVIFILISIGYISLRLSVFSSFEISSLGKFVIYFALPALIFRAMSERSLTEIFNIGYLSAYLAGSLLMFFSGYWWSRRVSKLPTMESTFQAMAMSCANSGFIGYPILLMVLPETASTALALAMIIENLFLIPLVLVMAERATGGEKRGWELAKQIGSRLIRNPIIGAIAAGLFASLLDLEVPITIAKSIDFLAVSSTAIALFVIGGSLPELPFRSRNKKIAPAVVGKLILHPLAVWMGLMTAAAVGIETGDPQLAVAAVILASMPTMGIYPILAQRYGQKGGAAVIMLVMTVLSFFSISMFLRLLNVGVAG
jgi:malonate transporter and related proteins